jgi:hypothetical protein
MSIKLPRPVADLIKATHSFSTDAFMDTFADGAVVNDRHREFWGKEAIKRWCEIEITGDRVTMEASHIVHHFGDVILTAKFGGDYERAADKPANLPNVLYLALYISLREEKIVQMIVLPINGRNLSAPTTTSEAATPFSTPLKLQ